MSNIQDPSDIEGALGIEVYEGSQKVLRLDLPDAHEDELVVGVAGQKHGQEPLGVLQPDLVPRGLLGTGLNRMNNVCRDVENLPELATSPCEPAPH